MTKKINQPLGGNEMSRFGGPAALMRLQMQASAEGLDACFVGIGADDFDWPRQRGFRAVQAEECWHKSLAPQMVEVRTQMGDGPVYLSFDIDSLDPAVARGTFTPEIGGLTSIQAMEIIRSCWGLNLVGCDLVEVSPPYDPSGNTVLTAANLLFEMLSVPPSVMRR